MILCLSGYIISWYSVAYKYSTSKYNYVVVYDSIGFDTQVSLLNIK